MILGEVRDGVYDLFLFLHILAVIVGFGAVVLNAVYAAQAKARTGLASLAIVEANSFVGWRIAEYFIYAVPILGFALLGLSKDPTTDTFVWEFSEFWVWGSLVLYIIGIAISHTVLKKAEREFRETLTSSAATVPGVRVADVPRLVELDKRLAAAGGTLNVILLLVLIFMVWKPGH